MRVNYVIWGTILCCLLSGCTGEKDLEPENNMAILSFGTLLNNFSDNNGKALEQLPDCSPAIPAFVELILSQDGKFILGTRENPFIVDLGTKINSELSNSTSNYTTQENSNLELEAGMYTLEYFAVLDSNKNLIWIAPISDGYSPFQYFVRQALPFEINLESGTKKYVDVEVLCFDNRLVNQYGYNYLKASQASEIEFCIFGNICDENGRHDILSFTVDGWNYSGNPENPKGSVLFTKASNSIVITDYEDHAETSEIPACIKLPDVSNIEDFYYLEIKDKNSKILRSGVITDSQVKSLYTNNGHIDYYHLREGNCNLQDSPDLFPTLAQ